MSPSSPVESELQAARRHRRPSTRGAVSMPTAAAAAGSNGIRMGSLSSYTLLDKLGGGAFGVVRRVRHRRSGEVVAIKSPRHGGDELLREASLIAACGGDPAVVALRNVARGRGRGRGPNNNAGDDVHLVMEFVGPKDLHDVLLERCRGGEHFTDAEARRVMRQLLAGVERMHARGVVHCDLKPGNVLVGDGGRLKICDFGLAMSMSVPAPADTLFQGTPSYMAPELLLGGNDHVAAVDVWSLGCVMAEIVAGKPLFYEQNEFELAMAIIRFLGIPDDISGFPLKVATPSKLRDVVPEERLSQAGFDVLRGLLESSPNDRLTAAAALQMPWFALDKNDDSPSSSSSVN